jgi:hypothetical protein
MPQPVLFGQAKLLGNATRCRFFAGLSTASSKNFVERRLAGQVRHFLRLQPQSEHFALYNSMTTVVCS